MPRRIAEPVLIPAAGTRPKRIEEYAGRVASGHAGLSVVPAVAPATVHRDP